MTGSRDDFIEGLIDEHLRLIETWDARRQRGGNFFLQLDVATNPSNWVNRYDPDAAGFQPCLELPLLRTGKSERTAFLHPLLIHLLNELQSRAFPAQLGPPSGFAVNPKRYLQSTCTIMQALMTKFFSDEGGLRLDWAELACADFAGGRLRFRSADDPAGTYCNGEPDSANVYLLGELAILASTQLESNEDRALWTALTPALLAIRRVYQEAYRPAPPIQWRRFTMRSFSRAVECSPERMGELKKQVVDEASGDFASYSIKATRADFPDGL